MMVDLIRSAWVWLLVALVTIVSFFVVCAASLILILFDRDRKRIHPLIRFWAKWILFVAPLMRVRFDIQEKPRSRDTYIFVANHQSLADILVVLHLEHPFKFIAKRELFWIPFFGWGLWVAGYIPLVRGNKASGKRAMEQARAYLKRGTSVLFFPEGTRSPDGEIHDFKIGAFKLSEELGIPVVPIVIDGTHNLLPKGSKRFRDRTAVLATVNAPVFPARRTDRSAQELMEEVRSGMIRRLKEIRMKVGNRHACSLDTGVTLPCYDSASK